MNEYQKTKKKQSRDIRRNNDNKPNWSASENVSKVLFSEYSETDIKVEDFCPKRKLVYITSNPPKRTIIIP